MGEFTDAVVRKMDELGLSRRALAAKIHASPAYVTKILRGDANFTLRSMTKLAHAVDSVLCIHLAPLGRGHPLGPKQLVRRARDVDPR